MGGIRAGLSGTDRRKFLEVMYMFIILIVAMVYKCLYMSKLNEVCTILCELYLNNAVFKRKGEYGFISNA